MTKHKPCGYLFPYTDPIRQCVLLPGHEPEPHHSPAEPEQSPSERAAERSYANQKPDPDPVSALAKTPLPEEPTP